MKMYRTAIGVAALLVNCATMSLAAPKEGGTAEARGRALLEQMNSLSVSIVNTADELALEASMQHKTAKQCDGINTLRDQVNQANLNLRVLEAQKEILPEWENRAIAEMTPVMRTLLDRTQKEIDTFNANSDRMWATEFPQDTAQVYQAAVRARTILDTQLKLANAQAQEESLESGVTPPTR
ncbi:MAG TPA: hypothetical protein VML19_26860 [Verrucomicrobiae bacterium]|nr:hypothetical protein [Verrucomicrobiae bacterium]